jgi:hypothetical protein
MQKNNGIFNKKKKKKTESLRVLSIEKGVRRPQLSVEPKIIHFRISRQYAPRRGPYFFVSDKLGIATNHGNYFLACLQFPGDELTFFFQSTENKTKKKLPAAVVGRMRHTIDAHEKKLLLVDSMASITI